MSEFINQTQLPVEHGCPERYHLGDTLVDWRRWAPGYDPVFPRKVDFETIQSRLAVGGFYIGDPDALVELSRLSTQEFTEAHGERAARLRNPLGRTGIAGTGLLWQAGENITADAAVIRRHPQEGLQLALVYNRGKWHLPGGFAKYDDELTNRRLVSIRELAEETNLDVEQITLAANPEILIPPGPKPRSRRSADMAWISNHVDLFLIADWRDGEEMRAGDDAERAAWICRSDVARIQRSGNMSPDHAEYTNRAFQAALGEQF